MNYQFKTILFVFGCYFLQAQQTPIHFSDNSHNFNAFGGSGFSIQVNPDETSDQVGQFFNDGSDAWQGFFIDLVNPIDLSVNQEITLSFYQFDPNNHNIIVKLENGNDVDIEVVRNTSGSGWANDIVFDFSSAMQSGTSNTINANGSYNRLVIFIDGGVNTAGTYLIDDINDGSEFIDPNAIDVEYTDLVWFDEFDINGTVDASKWFHQTLFPVGNSWFNGEEQHYTDRIENSYVENGFLNIVAKKENYTDQNVTKSYTSARLNSKFAFTYGRVDVRAKLPEGNGTWPAIWTLGQNINEFGAFWDNEGFGSVNWPACGEIDIMEHGLGATNHVSSALHSPSSFGNTVNTQSFTLTDVANNFHVYSVNWSPNQITFLIDGVGYYTYNPNVKDDSTWPFDDNHYLILNIAMGGFAGTIDSNFTESEMVVDYVRVYQNNLSADTPAINNVVVFPNPSKDYINIQSELHINRVTIVDVVGNIIIDKTQDLKSIDIRRLKTGVYFLNVQSDEKLITKKIIKN